MVNVSADQAKAIVNLADKIGGILTPEHSIVGIVTDGVPVARGLEKVLSKRGLHCRVDYILASSTLEFIDGRKLNALKATSWRRIYVDWRTKTGKLGQMLHARDGNGLYAVLSDPSHNADLSATAQDIPKLDLPKSYEGVMQTIGVWLEPHTPEEILQFGRVTYSQRTTVPSTQFYESLFRAIEEVLLT